MLSLRYSLLIYLLSYTVATAAVETISVVGLFGQQAVLLLDRQQHIISIGETTPEGVTLIDIIDDEVILAVAGEQQRYRMGEGTLRSNYSRPEYPQERIYRDINGMYRSTGVINGNPVDFLVDTGASSIAMSSVQAKRLGINYKQGIPINILTALGVGAGFRITLNSVSLGQITLNNVSAVVLEGNEPSQVLLGMSFLERLAIQHEGEMMLLQERF